MLDTSMNVQPEIAVLGKFSPVSTNPALERAILYALAYADVFDYPLTAAETHRYLVGLRTERDSVDQALQNSKLLGQTLVYRDGYYAFQGREQIIPLRRERAVYAGRLWPKAQLYGRWISRLPYVRMLAVTGSLAMDNVGESADVDYLVVTAPGRLWVCRALVVLLVRWAARRGDSLCPNFFISERALVYPLPSFYSAHEMAQMVPLSGLETYWRMRQLNTWTRDYLPNAHGLPRFLSKQFSRTGSRLQLLLEMTFRMPPGAWMERWEMQRKIRKFERINPDSVEAAFNQDWCKGHFDSHERDTERAFVKRTQWIDTILPG